MGVRPVCFTFDGFSDTSDLTLNGNATTVTVGEERVLRLTSANPNQAGSAFITEKVRVADGFCSTFVFQMTDAGGGDDDDEGPGADGIVFVVQNNTNNALGDGGGSLGYLGIDQSVGVEFDTFFNEQLSINDPNGNHVGINLNGSVESVVTETNLPSRLNNGGLWYALVTYSPETQLLEIRLSTPDIIPVEPTVSINVDLQDVLGSADAFVGFTAATGSAFENHDILFWEFCTPICR